MKRNIIFHNPILKGWGKVMLSVLAIYLGFLTTPTLAHSPSGHIWIAENFFEKYPDNPVAQECKDYKREFYAGAITPDIGVYCYFFEGGEPYKLYHNWNTWSRIRPVNTAENCYKYGYASHLISDATVHNGYIADQIQEKLLPNIPFHPLLELSDELYLQRTDRITVDVMTNSLGIMFENPRLIEITQDAIGQNAKNNPCGNVKEMTSKLSGTLGNFYSEAYINPEPDLSYFIYLWLAQYIKTNPQGMIQSRVDAVDNHNKIFLNLNERFACNEEFCPAEPHGFNRLKNAEAEASFTRLILIGATIGIGILFARRRK